jgi:hypothetical protein
MFDPAYNREDINLTNKQYSFVLNHLAKGLQSEGKTEVSVETLNKMSEDAYYIDDMVNTMTMPF